MSDLTRTDQLDLVQLARRKAKQTTDVIRQSAADREVELLRQLDARFTAEDMYVQVLTEEQLLPRDGNPHEATLLVEDFDPLIVRTGAGSVRGIALAVRAHADAVELLPITWSKCAISCPWFNPDATDLRTLCPGTADQQVRQQEPALTFRA
jgi:hypothetical protein